jgi:hypothetical protein
MDAIIEIQVREIAYKQLTTLAIIVAVGGFIAWKWKR